MISASLKRLRDEEIILQIGGRGIAKHYPCLDFLLLHALSDADLMPRSDARLMSFAVYASLGDVIPRASRAGEMKEATAGMAVASKQKAAETAVGDIHIITRFYPFALPICWQHKRI